MSHRLPGFDYTSPFFYMVTIKRMAGLAPLSAIVAPGRCELNAITRAFVAIIRGFHLRCPVIEQIGRFSVMPDHLHLVIKILAENPEALALTTIVARLILALERAYWEVKATEGEAEAQVMLAHLDAGDLKGLRPVFSADWHDWIVRKSGQLAAFTRYVRENPARKWLRQQNAQYFRSVREVSFLGRKWYGYGNLALLELPVLVALKGHRATAAGSAAWQKLVETAARIGSGGAGVSTFMSPLEKACGHALGLAGGKWIVLSPEGFGPRWHPSREYERFCAEGRMLFLSLYQAEAREPTNAELYARCHEMVDLAVAKLPACEG